MPGMAGDELQHGSAGSRHDGHRRPPGAVIRTRRFSKATGMSPLEYVHRLRIEETKQMLETGDAPVEAVAAEVGYQDTSFFGRLFRRRVGLTPAQYRRRFSSLRRALEKP